MFWLEVELFLFFSACLSVLPGFGNISPHTEGGRIFCILYALLGIPLFGFLLAGVGDQLGTIFGKGIAKVEKMIVVSNIGNFLFFFFDDQHNKCKALRRAVETKLDIVCLRGWEEDKNLKWGLIYSSVCYSLLSSPTLQQETKPAIWAAGGEETTSQWDSYNPHHALYFITQLITENYSGFTVNVFSFKN